MATLMEMREARVAREQRKLAVARAQIEVRAVADRLKVLVRTEQWDELRDALSDGFRIVDAIDPIADAETVGG